jgi:hypothetical protein
MKIGEKLYARMPEHIRACFEKLPNPGSDEVVSGFPESASQRSEVTSKPGDIYGGGSGLPSHTGVYGFDDKGSAARFFYTAKADADDRLGSKHPTVKPLDLMQWLVRLITPPGGHVLDCFAGTGTTAEAALREGFRCTLIEREAEYLADIDRRMAHVFDGEVGRGVAIAKTKPDSTAPAPLLDYIYERDPRYRCTHCDIERRLSQFSGGCPNCGKTMTPVVTVFIE